MQGPGRLGELCAGQARHIAHGLQHGSRARGNRSDGAQRITGLHPRCAAAAHRVHREDARDQATALHLDQRPHHRIAIAEGEGREDRVPFRGQAQRNLRLHAEGAAIAEEQPCQVRPHMPPEAGAVAQRKGTGARHAAIGQHHGKADDAIHATRQVLRHHAAHRGDRARNGRGLRRAQAVPGQFFRQRLPGHAGANHGREVRGIHADGVEPRRIQHHRRAARHDPRGVGKPRAARHHRKPVLRHEAHGRGRLFGIPRADHQRRGRRAGPVEQVSGGQGATLGIGRHMRRAEQGAQRLRQFGHAGASGRLNRRIALFRRIFFSGSGRKSRSIISFIARSGSITDQSVPNRNLSWP